MTFDAFGVRILARIKAAARISHLADHIIKRLLCDAARKVVLGHLKEMQIQTRQERIVVEHLLEMRHEPLRVHRVTMKPAAELIVYAAFGHLAAGVLDYFQRLA